MRKSAWLMTLSAVCLTVALVGAVSVGAESQDGKLLKGYSQGSGTGGSNSSGSGSLLNKAQMSQEGRSDWKSQGQGKPRAPSHNSTLTPSQPSPQPQSQTPGGTKIP
jgi:hypothetical protein